MNEEVFSYSATLADSIALLTEICDELQCIGFNICLITDLKEFAGLLEDGEVLPMDIAILESSDVPLVKEVVAYILYINQSIQTLANLNPEAAQMLDNKENPGIALFPGEIELPDEKTVEAWAESFFDYNSGASLSVFCQIYRLIHRTDHLPDDVFLALYDEEGIYDRIREDSNIALLDRVANRLLQGEDGE